MLTAPPLNQLARYPITGGVCILAIGVTIAWQMHYSIEPLTLSGVHLFDQPWRLFTSILPHVNVFHIMFNVYWTWTFGTFLERQFGHLATLAIILILAAGSGAAELAVLDGGVGLSGVGYGMFGILWVLSYRDPRFRGVIDSGTILTFVGWFLLCIVLTVVHVMPVANVAHGMGAAIGAAMGWFIAQRGKLRLAAGAVVAGLLGASLLGASVLRPWVNFSDQAGNEYVNAGCDFLKAQEPARAVPLLQKATRFRSEDGYGWYNLGVAYGEMNEPLKAKACFRKALEIAPDAEFAAAARIMAGEAPDAQAGAATNP